MHLHTCVTGQEGSCLFSNYYACAASWPHLTRARGHVPVSLQLTGLPLAPLVIRIQPSDVRQTCFAMAALRLCLLDCLLPQLHVDVMLTCILSSQHLFGSSHADYHGEPVEPANFTNGYAYDKA